MKKLILSFFAILCSLSVFSQSSTWSVDNEWVVRDKYNTGKKEKFFAIGIWGIPEYKSAPNIRKDSPFAYQKNKNIFKKYTKLFNMFYSHSGYTRDYMGDKIIVSGSSEFPWYFRRYMDRVDKRSSSAVKTKGVNMSLLERHTRNGLLNSEINDAINLVINSHKKNGIGDYIWAPIDEVSSWPPILLEKIYKGIKARGNKQLVYIDLAGSGKIRSFKSQQKNPITTSYSSSNFDNEWYENVKQIAYEYRNTGDVFGLNTYRDFFQKPKLAGITVDAIKDGVGSNIPVWLWFDSAIYAKPKNVSLSSYLANVRCQMYTSIIHGASGIMVYTDTRREPTAFKALLPIIEEINNLVPLIKSATIEKSSDGDIHYIVKKYNNKKIVIVSNTDRDNTKKITYPVSRSLAPMEVYVGEI